MSRFIRCIPAALLLAAGAAHAADLVPGEKKKLEAYFDGLQQQGLVSGSVAISERGVKRYERSIGFASIENGAPQAADAGTRYRIGAVSKLFTAVLALELAEQATITLDNKVAEFFPDVPNALRISYRDLLRERSGLADYRDAPGFDSWRRTPRTRDDMVAVIRDGGIHFAPGERVEHVGTNYLLMGYVLEKVHERPYADILPRLTGKIGLARTYYAGAGGATTLESTSYRWTDAGWQPVADDDPSVDGGAGALVSNAGDLVAFMDALFGGKLVTTYSPGSMRDADDTGAGVALRPLTVAGRTCLGERGRTAAFDAFVCHFADRRITIAWTGNATRVPTDELLDEIGRLVFRRAR
jgi:CubicO group peptidase (beta-lactamase class C family)